MSEELGHEVYVSPSQLRGLLPAAITEQYTFWQRVSGTSRAGGVGGGAGGVAGGGAGGSNVARGSEICGVLTGYIRPRWRRRAAARRDGLGRLVVTIVPGSSDSTSQLGDALVQRFPLIPMERSGTTSGPPHNAGAGLRLLGNGSGGGGGGLDGGEDGGDGDGDGSEDEDADVNRARETRRRHTRRGEEDENAVQESLIGVGSSDMIDNSRPPMTLISLAHVSQRSSDGGVLAALRMAMGRLDDLSHCLVWTDTPLDDSGESKTIDDLAAMGAEVRGRSLKIALVELPRVGLSFRADTSANSYNRLGNSGAPGAWMQCEEHEGLVVAHSVDGCPLLTKLLGGIPHGLILERTGDAALFLLLPAGAKPMGARLFGTGGTSSMELVIERDDRHWNKRLGPVKHYLYPIHKSRSFILTPTLASALYLMTIRLIEGETETKLHINNINNYIT